MNQSKAKRQTLSFVLRLWLETGDATDPTHSRGQIEAVASGETIHFDELSDILPILRDWVARARTDPEAPDKDSSGNKFIISEIRD